MPVTTHKNDN